jgi:hypothetical protein
MPKHIRDSTGPAELSSQVAADPAMRRRIPRRMEPCTRVPSRHWWVTNCLTLNDEDCSTSALPGSDIWPFNAAASDSTEVPSPLSPARVATGASVNKHPPIKAASTNFPALMLMSLGTSDRHEYVLTEKGLDLFPVIVVLSQWGSRRFPGLHEPRLILLIPPRKFCAMKTPE